MAAVANVMEQVAQSFLQTQFFGATSLPGATHPSAWLPMALLAKALPGASGSLALEQMQEKDRNCGNWRYTVAAGKAKWKSLLRASHSFRIAGHPEVNDEMRADRYWSEVFRGQMS